MNPENIENLEKICGEKLDEKEFKQKFMSLYVSLH